MSEGVNMTQGQSVPTSSQTIVIQVGQPQRAKFEDIIQAATEAITNAGDNPPQSITNFLKWLQETANPKVRQMMNSLPENILTQYRNAFQEQVATACGKHQRAKFEDIINAAITAINMMGKNAPKSLLDFRKWLQETANPKVRQMMNSLPENILTQYQNAFQQVVDEACGYQSFPLPSISSINPNTAQQDEELEITINGANFPEDPKVEFLIGENVDSSIEVSSVIRENGGAIKIKIKVNDSAQASPRTLRISSAQYSQLSAILPDALTITASPLQSAPPPPEYAPNCNDGKDNDLDGKTDLADEDCDDPEGPGEGKPTWQNLGRYWREKLKAELSIQSGISSYPWLDERDHSTGNPAIPTAQRPLMDQSNLGFHLNLGSEEDPVTIIGTENENPIVEGGPSWFRLLGNFYSYYQHSFHLDNDDNREGGLKLRLTPRTIILPDGKLAFDVYLAGNYRGTHYQYPNRYLFSGNQGGLTSGLSLQSNFGTNWIRGSIFSEYNDQWFDMTSESVPGGFSGQNQYGRTGLHLIIDTNKFSRYAPTITLEGAGLYGRGKVPETIGGSSYANLYGGEFKPTLLFKLRNYRLQVGGEFSWFNLGGFTTSDYRGFLKFDEDKSGNFIVSVLYTKNPALYYGGDMIGAGINWTLPEKWFPGASGITINSNIFRHHDGNRNNLLYGFGISIDILKILFPPLRSLKPSFL